MWGNPVMRGMYGMPSMLFTQAGAMEPHRWNAEDADGDEIDDWTTAGCGPGKKYARHLQRAGLMGPMMEAPQFGRYGGVALAPWMAPGFRPRGGFYCEGPGRMADHRAVMGRMRLTGSFSNAAYDKSDEE
ncbi:hypothetical protein B0A55_05206 [Friedmanniomyces simplex]|uniref:Uncharacterized protein n=1 Tax=Friedmanniomyces simplex TaxID=329884 RepID=A0A4U0XBZ2_9PEZI|nr:hypothetical protein B0A55_05206 [Friedmanniomyces simplex]